MMQLLNRRQRRNERSSAESLLHTDGRSPSDFAFDSRNVAKPVRSTPSRRHLNFDGTSGPQLHSLLEKVAASTSDKRLSRIKAGTKQKLKFIIERKTKESVDDNADAPGKKKSPTRIKASRKDRVKQNAFEDTTKTADDSSGEDVNTKAADDALAQNAIETLHTRALRLNVPVSPVSSSNTRSSRIKAMCVRKVRLKQSTTSKAVADVNETSHQTPGNICHPIQSNKVDSRLTIQTDESSGMLGRLLDNQSTVSTLVESTKGGSRLTLGTDESSGRKLQHILEKLVDHGDSIASSIEEFEGYEFPNSLLDVEVTPTRKELPSAVPSPNSVAFGFEPSKTRFEMNDSNEQSKMYLQDRRKKGKKTKRRTTPNRTEHMLKNCGVISQLEVSRSTVSMSSCSFDSVLDDPERLEKYRLLNQAPPSPPKCSRPRPRPRYLHKDSFKKSWADLVHETVGVVTRVFGCTS